MPMNREQLRAFAAKAKEKGFTNEQIMESVKRYEAKMPAAPTEQPPQPAGPGRAAGLGINQPKPQTTALEYGLGEGLASFGRGAAQLGAKVVPGDLEQRLLAQEEAKRAEWAAGRPSEEGETLPGGGAIGRFVGENAPLLVGGGAAAGTKLAGQGLGLGMRTLAGMGGGAVGGALQPLTTEEQEAGQGYVNTGLGAATGLLTPLATGGRAVGRYFGKGYASPQGALEDLAEKQLGAVKGKSHEAYKGLRKEIAGHIKGTKEEFNNLYSNLESSPNLPKINLLATGDDVASLGKKFSTKVINAVDRGTASTLKQLRGAATKQKVKPDGSATRVPVEVTLKEARDAQRSLKKRVRKLERLGKDDQADLLKKTIDSIDSDIDLWAQNNPQTVELVKQLKAVDKRYKDEVVPLLDTKKSIGKVMKTGDEKAFNREYLGVDTGSNVEELISRVPGAKKHLRELQGHNIIKARGPDPTENVLSGTTNEVLLSGAEGDYLRKLAPQLRRSENAAQFSPTPLGVTKYLLNMPPRVKKFGTKYKEDKALLDFLRGTVTGGVAGEAMTGE